jgi:hypothetical protein
MVINIAPLPTATISGTTTVCQNSGIANITFTGANSSAPYTFYYHINSGGSVQIISTTSGNNTVSISAPTSTPGNYIYYLDSISVGSCFNIISNQQAAVNIIETPTVNLAASTLVACPGDPITLTAIGATTLASIPGFYNWSGVGVNTSLATNTQVISYATPGMYVINVNYTANMAFVLNGCTSPPASITITIQGAPALIINNPNATICEGGCVTLTANGNGSSIVPSGYLWSPGGETTQSITVCPANTTNYSVIGFLGTCESPPATTVVNVTADPSSPNLIVSDTNICVGGSFTFNVNVAGGGGVGAATYQWYKNTILANFGGTAIVNGTGNGTQTGPAYTTQIFNLPGVHYYYCIVSYPGGIGCNPIASSVGTLNVISDPTVVINALNDTLCIGGTATCLAANVVGGIGSNTYLWMPNGPVNDTLCPPSNQVGTINYSVIVQQSGIGCGSLPSNQIGITVIPDPIIVISGITDACEDAIIPLSTIVTGGIGNVVQYEWQEANPIGSTYLPIVNSNSNNYTTLPLLNNVGYSVSIIQSGNGCAATDIHAIMIYDDPQLNLIGSPYSCLGEETSITANILGGTPGSTNSITWYAYPAGVSSPLIIQGPNNDLTYDFLLTGDTTIYVESVNSGFGCDLVTESITIQGLTPAVASFEVSNTIQSLIDPTFSFTNTSENATNYFWDLGECDTQAPTSELFTTPTPFYNPTNQDQIEYTYGCPPGLYQIMLIAYNQGICPDTAYQVIQIQDGVSVYIPNTFTPDGDMTNQYFFPVISSIISPNTFLFTIYNRWGEEVFNSKDPNEKWDGNNYITNNKCQDGVYIWKLHFIMKESGEVINEDGHVNLLR